MREVGVIASVVPRLPIWRLAHPPGRKRGVGPRSSRRIKVRDLSWQGSSLHVPDTRNKHHGRDALEKTHVFIARDALSRRCPQNNIIQSNPTFTAHTEFHKPRGLLHALHSLTSGYSGLECSEEYVSKTTIAVICR